MFAKTVRRLLELSSAGLSSDQILWRLKDSGLRFASADVLQSLTALVDSGEIVLQDSGRWRITTFQQKSPDLKGKPAQGSTGSSHVVLSAVSAIVSRRLPPDRLLQLSPETGGAGTNRADADWRKLLAYYAATQRLDPRGKVDQRADQHAVSWQLFRAEGCWWDVGELLIPIEALPASFREALMRRPREGSCCVGLRRRRFSGQSDKLKSDRSNEA
jgi:hypothetical protein